VPILWLSPKMTDRSLGFTALATLYFWLGSKHEEARLARAYGKPYGRYLESGVPFFLPTPRALAGFKVRDADPGPRGPGRRTEGRAGGV
jgi:hypothetical protein